MRSNAVLPLRRSELLFGTPTEAGDFSYASMPDDKQVCDCNGVCKGKIVEGDQGGKDIHSGSGKSNPRLSTSCGSCKKDRQGADRGGRWEVKTDPSEAWYVPAIPMDKPTLANEVRKRGLKAVSQVMAPSPQRKMKSPRWASRFCCGRSGKEYVSERTNCRFNTLIACTATFRRMAHFR